MRLTEYFQLTLEDRVAREKALKLLQPTKPPTTKPYTLEDYYSIEDCICSLTRLRNYQLADILGKYKLF